MITFDDFVTLQALMARQFSLTPECTKPTGQKLSRATHAQRHVGDQTHTYSTKDCHSGFEVLLLGTLGSSFIEHFKNISPFFPLQPHVWNELAFSKQSRSLFLFSSGFTSFAHYVRVLDHIPKVNLTDFFCILLKGKFFFY